MSFFKYYPKYKWALLILDIGLFVICFASALWITNRIFDIHPENYQHIWSFYAAYVCLSIVYFQFANLYKIQNIVSPPGHFFLIVKTLFFVVIGLILFQFFLKDFLIDSRLFYILFFTLLVFFFIVFRISFTAWLSTRSLIKDKVVILGGGLKGKAMLNIFKNRIKVNNVVGFLDDKLNTSEINGVPVLGKIEDAIKLAKPYQIKYFLLAIDNIDRKRFFEIFKFFREHNLGFAVSSDYLQILYDKLDIDLYDEFGMVRFGSNTESKFLGFVKRGFDVFFSTIGMLCLSPVYIALYLAIKLNSKGNAIYTQIRIGKNGKPFPFYKFRSMHINSDKDKQRASHVENFIRGVEDNSGKNTKIVNKKNITKVGAILRKFSLDELPQLWNVWKGDMSLVGPRPCLLNEWKVYEDWQKLRLNTIPGCTGIWQVTGRSKVDFEETVLMDIYYNHNYTPVLDLQIIFKTIPVMLLGQGGE